MHNTHAWICACADSTHEFCIWCVCVYIDRIHNSVYATIKMIIQSVNQTLVQPFSVCVVFHLAYCVCFHSDTFVCARVVLCQVLEWQIHLKENLSRSSRLFLAFFHSYEPICVTVSAQFTPIVTSIITS